MKRPIGLGLGGLLLCVATLGWSQTPIFNEPLSPRIANYRIDVSLDAKTKRIKGSEMILWHNKTDHPAQDLRFHLYLNGFRNEKMSFLKESGGAHRGNKMDKKGFGFSEIDKLQVIPDTSGTAPVIGNLSAHPQPEAMVDKTAQIEFLAPDDGNADDRTYFRVPLDEPLPPGGSVWIRIEWHAQLPQPPFSRTGAKEEFFFLGQWFPKIAVFKQDGKWTDHQFHLNTEFFADYGVYDVAMTVPADHILGATGLEVSVEEAEGGQKTHRYHAEDVHDFAWTSSPEYVEGKIQAQDVAIRVLCQRDHSAQMGRMLEATKKSVEYFQNYYGDYPFPNLTVIDPRYGADGAGGMEYPTLITAGTAFRLPEGIHVLELVILHEFGHNYWYHLLGSNEWEESWLDEGINTYTEMRIMDDWLGKGSFLDLLGYKVSDLNVQRLSYIGATSYDPTVRNGWEYYSSNSYSNNSYSKPGCVLTTFQNMIGRDKMDEIMRAYVARWRFKHPTSRDFMQVVNDVTGQNYDWFFEQALFTRHHLDYAVTVVNSEEDKKLRGFDLTLDINDANATADSKDDEDEDDKDKKDKTYTSTVKVRRLGEFVCPVEIEFTFADGEKRRERWDGQELWKRWEFPRDKELISAQVDPDQKLLMDINWVNNSYTREPKSKSLWAAFGNMLGRLQTLMELIGL